MPIKIDGARVFIKGHRFTVFEGGPPLSAKRPRTPAEIVNYLTSVVLYASTQSLPLSQVAEQVALFAHDLFPPQIFVGVKVWKNTASPEYFRGADDAPERSRLKLEPEQLGETIPGTLIEAALRTGQGILIPSTFDDNLFRLDLAQEEKVFKDRSNFIGNEEPLRRNTLGVNPDLITKWQSQLTGLQTFPIKTAQGQTLGYVFLGYNYVVTQHSPAFMLGIGAELGRFAAVMVEKSR